jgi:hypothetical protein
MGFRHQTIESLRARAPEFKREWLAPKPFPYVVIDDFLPKAAIGAILAEYPPPDSPAWTRKTYAHQREKLTMVAGFPEPIAEFFRMTEDTEFRDVISDITSIPKLIEDRDLIGGGLHQITRGGFLDVHIDFNFHPKSRLHRRLNLILYLNEEWKDEYEGYLELWDMDAKRRIERIAPTLNRAIIFATNEVSYHGHPTPLACPPDVTRKSLAIYYYTESRDDIRAVPEHNTVYRQTSGTTGYFKTAISTARVFGERLREDGVVRTAILAGGKAYRKLRGLPPRNA